MRKSISSHFKLFTMSGGILLGSCLALAQQSQQQQQPQSTQQPRQRPQQQQYICGTAAAGVFATDVGSLNCGDGKIHVVRKEDHLAFCNYMATCTPDVPLTRMFVESESRKRFETMTDDEINAATISAAVHNPDLHLEQIQMSVQCMGVMYTNPQGASMPRCPRVNECVNTRRHTNMMWNVRAYSATDPTSDGLMMRDSAHGSPVRVINPIRATDRGARQ